VLEGSQAPFSWLAFFCYLIHTNIKIYNMISTPARPFHKAPSLFKRWTKKDDIQLRLMIKEGKNSEEIATALGRTRSSVMGRKSALGIKTKMVAARGSKMPYVSFERERRTETLKKEEAPSVPMAKVETQKEKNEKIGKNIDRLIETAQSLGLSLTITITSDK